MTERTDPPPIAEVGQGKPTREIRRRVAAALARGAIVAMPTETVYGLAVRADSAEAVARLRALKGRPADSNLTWHVARREVIEGFAELRPLARRLAQRYWPGPLTLVLHAVPPGLEPVARDGWTGVRLPAHDATRELLSKLDFPVVMTSANLHGQEPLKDAASVAALFGEALELVIDGGSSRLGEASGVLRVGRGHFELLREGLLPIHDLRRTAGLRIGFVCTGNTCRSPMAEGLARALLQERLGTDRLEDFGFEVTSMGVFAGSGSPASEHAVEVLADMQIDIRQHASRPALPELVRDLDRVYALTEGHLEALRKTLPPNRARHLSLLDPSGADVSDPIGGTREDYERCAEKIRSSILARMEDWA